MNEFSFSHPSVEWLGAAVGVALIFFGRKLYWLALGGLGMMLGLLFARRILDLQSQGAELAIALGLALVGTIVAIQAQKMAIALAGFILGGGSVFWLGERLHTDSDWKLLVLVLLGAVIGYLLAQGLFELALVLSTTVIGASLVVNASQLGIRDQPWLFVPLVLIGALWQSRRKRRRH